MSMYTDEELGRALMSISESLKSLAKGLDEHTEVLKLLSRAMSTMNENIRSIK